MWDHLDLGENQSNPYRPGKELREERKKNPKGMGKGLQNSRAEPDPQAQTKATHDDYRNYYKPWTMQEAQIGGMKLG